MRTGPADSDMARRKFFPPRRCRRSRARPAFRTRPPHRAGAPPGASHMATLVIATTALPHRLVALLRGDARHFQIAALASLLAFNLGWIDFGARPLNSLLAIVAALATQMMCTRLWRLPAL